MIPDFRKTVRKYLECPYLPAGFRNATEEGLICTHIFALEWELENAMIICALLPHPGSGEVLQLLPVVSGFSKVAGSSVTACSCLS